MPTTEEVLKRSTRVFGTVPAYQPYSVCSLCFGPVDGYIRCYSCRELLNQGVPEDLYERVVPMTIADSPGIWYNKLMTYKKFQFAENAPIVVSLAWHYLITHKNSIETLLGGHWDLVTVVPSTKEGVTFDDQKLVRALKLLPNFVPLLHPVVRCRVPGRIGRRQFKPDSFECLPAVVGKRIVLLEDLWVTGATGISTAGALLNEGADQVVLMPLAREIHSGGGYYSPDLPYFSETKQPYDITKWPR